MVYSHTVGGVHSTHSPGGAVETETGELEVVQGSDVEGAPSVERDKRVHISQDCNMEQPPHSVYQYIHVHYMDLWRAVSVTVCSHSP